MGAISRLSVALFWLTAGYFGPIVDTLESQQLDNTGLRVVQNSGVCETTPGVGQVSGYIDVGTNMSMWFWFFEARKNPETAPFTLWLNGGPTCSSMIGLFQENGPCKVNDAGNETTLNPHSWNEISNMIYIDQPIGAGYSYGDATVDSTAHAAPWVWKAFQILFKSDLFHKYASRKFFLTTESYGGRYGPVFVTYFNQKNKEIEQGKIQGEKIVTSALLINNGWYDPLLQNKGYVDFATNAPGYGPLVNDTVLKQLNTEFYKKGGCKDQELACYAAGETPESNELCRTANVFCVKEVWTPAVGDRDPYDLRAPTDDPFPSKSYEKFLNTDSVKKQIGALSEYVTCPKGPSDLFENTGDVGRTTLPELEALVDSGLRTLIWAGDADIDCNWFASRECALAMNWTGKAELARTPLKDMTMKGEAVAQILNVDNFSFARIFESGHEVPAYQPEVALEIFRQIINGEDLHSVF